MSFRFVLNKRTTYQKIDCPIPRLPQFTCGLNGASFCGACQIKACHANIGADKHPSSCIYLFYDNNKREFDKYDILYALGLKEKSYRNQYHQGSTKTGVVVSLYRILHYLREQNKTPQCPHCGIFKLTDVFPCPRNTGCDTRRQIINNVLAQSYLSYPEMRTTVKDVYLVLKNLDKIRQYLESTPNEVNPNLPELLGLKPEIFDRLRAIPTQL